MFHFTLKPQADSYEQPRAKLKCKANNFACLVVMNMKGGMVLTAFSRLELFHIPDAHTTGSAKTHWQF